MEAGMTGVVLEMALQEKFLPGDLVLGVGAIRTDRSLVQEQERRLDRHHRHNALDRQKLRGLRQRQAADLAVDECLYVAHRAKIAQFIIVDRHLEHVFHEDHDFHHGERIDTQILDEAQVVVRVLELDAEIGFDETLDDADYDRRE